MSIYRMQCAFGADSAFATDRLVITPHFEATAPFEDVQSLVDDLADALAAYSPAVREVLVKAYDAQAAPPSFPVAEAIRNFGSYPVSGGVRETSICLSFFSERNRPRQRGRIYVPTAVAGIPTNGARPTATHRQKVADLVPIFAGLGGIDIDWVIYSRRDDVARKVSNWWVDDAWDHQRSRGLAPTARLEGTTSG